LNESNDCLRVYVCLTSVFPSFTPSFTPGFTTSFTTMPATLSRSAFESTTVVLTQVAQPPAGPAERAVQAGNAPESCCWQKLDQNTGGETNFKDHRQEGVVIEAVGHEEGQTQTGRTLSALRTRLLLPPGLFRILNVYATN
jgi:hypothetical protein